MDHYEIEHYYCNICNKLFYSQGDLREHKHQEHWYCESCDRVFNNDNSLEMHLKTSSIHNARSCVCPGRGCGKRFVSHGGLALHFESGACSSGINRRELNDFAIRHDHNNVITNPARLIAGPSGSHNRTQVVRQWASEASWNGFGYECILCHKEFRMLSSLNAHLESPVHDERIYRCPSRWDGCDAEFNTLSAILQHVERSTCGVTRFRPQVRSLLDGVTHGSMRTLTF